MTRSRSSVSSINEADRRDSKKEVGSVANRFLLWNPIVTCRQKRYSKGLVCKVEPLRSSQSYKQQCAELQHTQHSLST